MDYTNAGNGTINAQPERTNIYDNGVLQATDNGDLSGTATVTVNVTDVAEGPVLQDDNRYLTDEDTARLTGHRVEQQ